MMSLFAYGVSIPSAGGGKVVHVTYGFKEGILTILPILAIIIAIAIIHTIMAVWATKNKKELLAVFVGTIFSKTIGILFVLLLYHNQLFEDFTYIIMFFAFTITLEGLINTVMIKTDKQYKGLLLAITCNLASDILSFILLLKSLSLYQNFWIIVFLGLKKVIYKRRFFRL